MLYSVCSLLAYIVLKLFFRIEILGKNFIPKEGAFVLASNHLSNLDPIVLGGVSPRRLNFLAKKELFKTPLSSWFLSSLKAFPLKRNKVDFFATRRSIARLRQKEPLLVFPEGTRRKEEKRVHAGVGFLVSKTGCPVVPVKIYNTDKVLPPGRILPKLKKIKVVFGRPTLFDKSKNVQDIAQEVIGRINEL